MPPSFLKSRTWAHLAARVFDMTCHRVSVRHKSLTAPRDARSPSQPFLGMNLHWLFVQVGRVLTETVNPIEFDSFLRQENRAFEKKPIRSLPMLAMAALTRVQDEGSSLPRKDAHTIYQCAPGHISSGHLNVSVATALHVQQRAAGVFCFFPFNKMQLQEKNRLLLRQSAFAADHSHHGSVCAILDGCTSSLSL